MGEGVALTGNHRYCLGSFSNLNEHTKHLGIVEKCRLRFSRSSVEPRSLIPDKLPANAEAAHLQTTLTRNSKGEGHARNWDFIRSDTGKKLLKGFKEVSDMNSVIFKITLIS